MSLASKASESMSDPRRLVGRHASRCRRCGGSEHYVNLLDGIECVRCHPPSRDSDIVYSLWCVNGKWHDAPPETAAIASRHDKTTPKSSCRLDLVEELFSTPETHSPVTTPDNEWGDLAELVGWYRENRDTLPPFGPIRLHNPGRPARDLREINHQLTPVIINPLAFYHSLDIEIDVQGPHGPRVATGTLKADLEKLREIFK